MTGILSPGAIINDNYQLIAPIGEGGMGSVYKARQLNVDRIVALKFLHRSQLTDKDSRARFMREGKLLSQFTHAHIPAFYEFGLWNAQYPYIAMEFLEGKSLRAILTESSRMSWTRCLYIATQICEAMAAAHQHGIVHRDLKPNNVMLLLQPSTDYVKIVDFGLARIAGQSFNSHTLTETGLLIGSIYYMSPEQCMGRKADARADIYALGCILYEALTGKPPLEADTPIAMMHKHVNTLPPPVSSLINDRTMPQALDFVIERAMAKDPAERYQSMQELADDLRLVAAGEGRVSGAVTHRGLKVRRTHVPKAILLGGLLLTAGGIGLFSDEGACLMASMRCNGAHRYDELLFRAKDLNNQQRYGAATKLFQLVGDQAPRRLERAMALVELSGLFAKTNKQDESIIYGKKAIIMLARTSKRMTAGEEESDTKLVASLVERQLSLLNDEGVSITFDCSVSSKESEIAGALRNLKSYFVGLDGFPQTLLSMEQFEQASIDGCAASNPVFVADYYGMLAEAYLKGTNLADALKACDRMLFFESKSPTANLSLGFQKINLASSIVACRAVFGDSENQSAKSATEMAKKLLVSAEPIFNLELFGLGTQLDYTMWLDARLSVAQTYIALKLPQQARIHLNQGLYLSQRTKLTPEGILTLSKTYGCLAQIDMDTGPPAQAAKVLTNATAILSKYSGLSYRAINLDQFDQGTAVEIARIQIHLWTGDLRLRENQLKQAEVSYKEASVLLHNLMCAVNELGGHVPGAVQQTLVKRREIIDSCTLELATKIRRCFLLQHRSNDLIGFYRETIATCREHSRYCASGAMYNYLVEALILSGRYSDLDAILHECQTPVLIGPGWYEPKVRFTILLTAARIYSQLGENERAIEALVHAKGRFEKQGGVEQRVNFNLLLGNAMIATGKLAEGRKYLLGADELAIHEVPALRRSTLIALAYLHLLQNNFSAAEELLSDANGLPALIDEDPLLECAFLRASRQDYAGAVKLLSGGQGKEPPDIQRLVRIECLAELARMFKKREDLLKYSKQAAMVLQQILGNKHPAVVRALHHLS